MHKPCRLSLRSRPGILSCCAVAYRCAEDGPQVCRGRFGRSFCQWSKKPNVYLDSFSASSVSHEIEKFENCQPRPSPTSLCFLGQVLYLLGAMLLSMALQLDRHGLWNLLGPSLFALGIMAVAWVRSSPLSSGGPDP